MPTGKRLQLLVARAAIVAACGIAVPAIVAQEQAEAPAVAPAPERTSRLQGSAYLDRNNDVAGATVVVNASASPSLLYLTSTNAAGRFKIDGLPDGEYQVRIEHHGVQPVRKDAVQVKFPFRAVIELDMEPAAAGQVATPAGQVDGSAAVASPVVLSGTVRDEDLAPLAAAGVRLVHAGATVDPVLVESDEDGNFSVADVPGGTWQLTILGVGTLPIRTHVTLAADTRLEATLVRQPASYVPSPLDLMPPEQPIPPPRLAPSRVGG